MEIIPNDSTYNTYDKHKYRSFYRKSIVPYSKKITIDKLCAFVYVLFIEQQKG